MESQIKWKRGDYIKLSKAVSRFNKILGDLDTQADYLPEAPEYKNLRDHIHTRKELNRVIASLQSATPENLKSTVLMESGVEISKYEYRQLRLARNRALRNLAKEKRTILEDRPSIGMGDERLSEIRAIEASFEKLETSSGATFDRLAERIINETNNPTHHPCILRACRFLTKQCCRYGAGAQIGNGTQCYRQSLCRLSRRAETCGGKHQGHAQGAGPSLHLPQCQRGGKDERTLAR